MTSVIELIKRSSGTPHALYRLRQLGERQVAAAATGLVDAQSSFTCYRPGDHDDDETVLQRRPNTGFYPSLPMAPKRNGQFWRGRRILLK